MPKFHTFALPARHPNRPAAPVAPPKGPAPKGIDLQMKDLLKTLEPEPTKIFKSKLMALGATPAPDRVQREVNDILDILRNVNKK